MKIQLLTLAMLLCGINAWAITSYQLVSPDGKLKADITIGNDITYTLMHESTQILSPSSISMTLESGEILGENPKVTKVKKSSENRIIQSPIYKKSEIKDNYNELALTFKGNYGLIFRAYDDGFAYRFTTSRKDELIINSEEFTLNFPEDFKAYAPYTDSNAKTLEEQTMTSFENAYAHENITKLDNQKLIFLPILVEVGDGKKLCVTEADLYGFPGTFLTSSTQTPTFKAYHAKYPLKDEPFNSSHKVTERANYIARSTGTRVFPWRIMIVAQNDAQLLNNDMVYKIAEPSRIDDISWIKPGKTAWEWWHASNLYGVDFRSGMNNNTYKYYIDFAAKNGVEYILLDGGWYKNSVFESAPDIDLEDLIAYANDKNIGIILWMGYRDFHHDMENIASHFSKLGIKGFKIDFMDRDDQKITDYIYEAAEICARHHIMIDFHGIYKPTGLQRTWPNVINYEGVRGLEYAKFDRSINMDMPGYAVTMPYIRMIAGPIDYTQGAMRNATKNNYRAVNSEPMSQGTRCQQLAEYVVFCSPLSMMCDNPVDYTRNQECTDFIAKAPTVWDETVAIDGKIGEYIALARRKGNDWYLGAMTNWNARDLTIDLSFLGEGDYTIELFRDGINADKNAQDYKKEVFKVPSNRKLQIHLAPGGGAAARIYK